MYRAVCWWCLETGVDLSDEAAVAAGGPATRRWLMVTDPGSGRA